MRDTKYILFDTNCYDYHQLQQKLTRYAEQGWHLEKVGNLLWKFRRGQPKAVRYEITYSPAASAFNSRPTDSEEDLAELCAQAGWERVGTLAQVQIYRNADPNATPLETDEVQKIENIRKTMGKHFIPQHLLLIVLFLLQLLMQGSTAMQYPTRTLSSMLIVCTLGMLLAVSLMYTVMLLGNLLWLRRARMEVDAGRPIPPNDFYRKFRWVIWGVLAVYLLALLLWVEPVFTVLVLSISALLLCCILGTTKLCKWLNAPRWVNIVAPVVTGTLVVMLTMFLFIATMDRARTEEIPSTADALPLTLTQLTGETETERAVLEEQGSILVGYQRCWDRSDNAQINYIVVDIHCPLLYDIILNEQEQSYLEGGWQFDSALTTNQRNILDAQYLRHSTTRVYDRWLICWEDRIVLLRASWVLSDEQLAIVADALQP